MTSIIAGNERARRLLTAGLPGLPTYRKLCTFSTVVFPLRRSGKVRARHGLVIKRARQAQLPELARFLQRSHRQYQCAPYWTETSLQSSERCRGLRTEDFLLAYSDERLSGCLALWDQQAFKQNIVRGYDARLRRWRPLFNLVAPLAGLPHLPAVDAALDHAYLTHVAVEDDAPEVLESLVRAAAQAAARRGHHSMLLGLSEDRPLLNAIRRRFRHLEYRSILYLAFWDDGAEAVRALDDRPVHVEVATL